MHKLARELERLGTKKSVIAENYASERGYGSDKTRVAVFRESLRHNSSAAQATRSPLIYLNIKSIPLSENKGMPAGVCDLPAQSCLDQHSLAVTPLCPFPLTHQHRGRQLIHPDSYLHECQPRLANRSDRRSRSSTDTTGLTETNSSQTLTFTVSPIDNTTYRLKPKAPAAVPSSAEVTIIVNYPPPEIIQFNATPACINRGQSATLNFQVRYAASITITGPRRKSDIPWQHRSHDNLRKPRRLSNDRYDLYNHCNRPGR